MGTRRRVLVWRDPFHLSGQPGAFSPRPLKEVESGTSSAGGLRPSTQIASTLQHRAGFVSLRLRRLHGRKNTWFTEMKKTEKQCLIGRPNEGRCNTTLGTLRCHAQAWPAISLSPWRSLNPVECKPKEAMTSSKKECICMEEKKEYPSLLSWPCLRPRRHGPANGVMFKQFQLLFAFS